MTNGPSLLDYHAQHRHSPRLPGWVVLLNLPLIAVGLVPAGPNEHFEFLSSMMGMAVMPAIRPLSFFARPDLLTLSIQLFYATALLPPASLFLQWHLYRPRRLGGLRPISMCLIVLLNLWMPLFVLLIIQSRFFGGLKPLLLVIPVVIVTATLFIGWRRWRDPVKDYVPAILTAGSYLAAMALIAALSLSQQTISRWLQWGSFLAVGIALIQIIRLARTR